VIGVPLVEPAQQRGVDRGLRAVRPVVVQQDLEEVPLQLVHAVVVVLQLRGQIGVRAGEHVGDFAGHPVGDVAHLLEHRAQLGRHGRRRVPAPGRLGHVLGQIAHPLQVGGDVQRGDDGPQVGRDRRLPRDGVGHLDLHVAVELVDFDVAFDDRLGGLQIRREQRRRGLTQRGSHGLRHGHQQPADLVEVGLKLLAHHPSRGSGLCLSRGGSRGLPHAMCVRRRRRERW
jgi:hypothetical protein